MTVVYRTRLAFYRILVGLFFRVASFWAVGVFPRIVGSRRETAEERLELGEDLGRDQVFDDRPR